MKRLLLSVLLFGCLVVPVQSSVQPPTQWSVKFQNTCYVDCYYDSFWLEEQCYWVMIVSWSKPKDVGATLTCTSVEQPNYQGTRQLPAGVEHGTEVFQFLFNDCDDSGGPGNCVPTQNFDAEITQGTTIRAWEYQYFMSHIVDGGHGALNSGCQQAHGNAN